VQSRKQSDAKPPDGTVFFIDRSLGVEPIRTELINCGLAVEMHDDSFARDEEDRVWLKAVGARLGRADQRPEAEIPPAGDQRIAGQQRAGIRPHHRIAAAFVRALPRICRILRSRAGPFVARVSQTGHIAIA
jgi:hypothetical protein